MRILPNEVLEKTLRGYDANSFIENLRSHVPYPFDDKDIEQVISQYYLGTICHGERKRAITFPFIDKNGKIRAIQAKQFDESNHTVSTDFLHSIIERHCVKHNKPLPEWLVAYNNNASKVSCLFGGHLLAKNLNNPVALVEAPKTAIIATLYFGFPNNTNNLLWLAVYNLSSLSFEKCKALKGRNVVLFPDLSKNGNAYDLWHKKADEFNTLMANTKFTVSDLLEKNANEEERLKGCDLADFLIKQDWREFREQEQSRKIDISDTDLPDEIIEPIFIKETFFNIGNEEPHVNWEQDITELKAFFDSAELPTSPIKLNKSHTITDVHLFVNSHLLTVENNKNKRTFLPYLDRLKELKKYLENLP